MGNTTEGNAAAALERVAGQATRAAEKQHDAASGLDRIADQVAALENRVGALVSATEALDEIRAGLKKQQEENAAMRSSFMQHVTAVASEAKNTLRVIHETAEVAKQIRGLSGGAVQTAEGLQRASTLMQSMGLLLQRNHTALQAHVEIMEDLAEGVQQGNIAQQFLAAGQQQPEPANGDAPLDEETAQRLIQMMADLNAHSQQVKAAIDEAGLGEG